MLTTHVLLPPASNLVTGKHALDNGALIASQLVLKAVDSFGRELSGCGFTHFPQKEGLHQITQFSKGICLPRVVVMDEMTPEAFASLLAGLD